jgi:hypothetical protein
VRKILNTRLFEKAGKSWDASAKVTLSHQHHHCMRAAHVLFGMLHVLRQQELDLEILCVSQFTLYGQLKGNKPDFHTAMAPEQARTFYAKFLEQLKATYTAERVQDGAFGEMMSVDLTNDGPVTLVLQSDKE